MLAAHGPSFKYVPRWIDAAKPTSIAAHWLAYLDGGDGAYPFDDFVERVTNGTLLLAEIDQVGSLVPVARVGFEGLRDEDGPYAQWTYVSGVGLRDWIDDLARLSEMVAFKVCFPHPMRLRLGGRKGWQRAIRYLGGYKMEGEFVTTEVRQWV